MSHLSEEKCVPCRGGTPPLTHSEYEPLLQELSKEWSIQDEQKLQRSFGFKDFKSALVFTNKVGELAEQQGHHPDILLSWGKVEIVLWTHKIKGLSKSDFIMAAKIDAL
jgi:4a-hydroxytetrahydrobiopterin dehydratase